MILFGVFVCVVIVVVVACILVGDSDGCIWFVDLTCI